MKPMTHKNTDPSGFGIYVHVPWCRARCPYCAFNIAVDSRPPVKRWQREILSAWEHVAPAFEGPAVSLFFGGGTPSLLDPSVVGELIQALPLASGAEVTLEANPGTVDAQKLAQFLAVGVNRVSLGVQSFQTPIARRLGRGHTIKQALELMNVVADLGFGSWSIDLIFGVPGQSLAQLDRDLDIVLQHAPPHISLYGLSIEPNTAFAVARDAGTLHLPKPDLWRAMYDRIVDRLASKWVRYEVSNFAQVGHRGIHNEDVWRGGFYAGLGPGAHGFHPTGQRTTSVSDIGKWLNAPRPSPSRPAPLAAATDHVLTTVRHIDGLDLDRLAKQTGYGVSAACIDAIVRGGLMTRDQQHVRLTSTGFPLADGIIARLADHLYLKPTQLDSPRPGWSKRDATFQ
jgi:putative oxygen-independent coproporphyrinogen III oxidase